MFTIGPSSLGIEFREDRVIVTHLRKSFGKLWVTGTQEIRLSNEKPREERELELIDALQRFVAQQNASKDRVFLALPREKTLVKLLSLPSAAKENLRKVIEYELAKHVPFPAEEAVFDFQIIEEKEGTLHTLLVVTKAEIVNEHLELLRRIGILPVAVEISSTALANLFNYDQQLQGQESFVLIDIKDRFSEFQFFEKGQIVETIHYAFSDPVEKARELAEVYRLAQLKGLGPKDGRLNLYVFGEGVDDTLIKELKEGLSYDVTGAPSLGRVRSADGVVRTSRSYSAIGLALRGLQKTRWNINLLPLPLQKKESRIGIYLAIFLVIVSVILGGHLAIRPLIQERQELKMLNEAVEEIKPKIATVQMLQTKKESIEKEIREFETLIAEGTSRLEILKELSEILPSTVWIWNLKLRGRDVEINGFANSASDLIAILDKSQFFEKVEFSSPVTKERRLFGDQAEKERFRISAKIERAR